MEFMKNKIVLVLLLVTFFCTACAPNIIRGRPPFVSITSLSLEGDRLAMNFNVSNENGESMDIDGVEIDVRIEDAELTRYNEDFRLSIDANSSEQIKVEEFPDSFIQDLLASLEDGNVNSLPFRLEGNVHTEKDGLLRFRHKGHLYPVPGRPGHFRSASTQSSRIGQSDPYREIDDRD